MREIWKFEVFLRSDHTVVTAPGLGKALFFAVQDDRLFAWCEVEPAQPLMRCELKIVGTGHSFSQHSWRYVGSLQEGPLVWHLLQAQRVREVVTDPSVSSAAP